MKIKILDCLFWTLTFIAACGFIREFLPLYELIWTKPVDIYIQSVLTNIWDWRPHRQPDKNPPFDNAWVLGILTCLIFRMAATYSIFRFFCFLIDRYKEMRLHWLKK